MAEESRILLQGGAGSLHIPAIVILALYGLEEVPQEHVVVFPGDFLLFYQFGKVRVFFQQRGYGVVYELEIGIEFLGGGVEFLLCCICTGAGLSGKGADDGEHTEIEVSGSLTGALQLGLGVCERHSRILDS